MDELTGHHLVLARTRLVGAADDVRPADTIAETEMLASGGQGPCVQPVDHSDAFEPLSDVHGLVKPVDAATGDNDADVDVPAAERGNPVLRIAGSDVAEHDVAGRHPLAKLIGERGERVPRHA